MILVEIGTSVSPIRKTDHALVGNVNLDLINTENLFINQV